MKIDKIDINGKKNTIEVLDKIFSGKINKRLVDNVIYRRCYWRKGKETGWKRRVWNNWP